MDSNPSGVVTVAYDASIVFWPAAALRSAAEGGGISISEPSTLQEQWPLRVFDPQDVPAVSSQPFVPRPATTPAGALRFSDDASRWQIEYSDLTLTRVIGEGAFGKVYLGRWHETDVAIKMLSSLSAFGLPSAGEVGTNAAGEAIKTLEREVALMVNMRHPNVILFMGICPEPFCIVTEYCSRGSLYDLLRSARNDSVLAQQLNWPRRLVLAMDSAKGMLYLHSHKPHVIHRDLKSPNLLVDGQWRAKVTDFNLSRLSETPSVASSVAANNPRWQAPEVIHSRDFSASGDVYAFGLILWELATWELPFEQFTQFQIILNVGEKGCRPEIPDPSSPLLRGGDFPGYADYVALMEACWAQNPKDRPGFDQIIAMLRKIVVGLGSDGGQTAPVLSEEKLPLNKVEQRRPAFVPMSNDQYNAAIHSPFEGAAEPLKSPFEGAAEPLKSPFDEAPTAAAAVVNVPANPFGEVGISPFDAPAAAALPSIKVPPSQTVVPLRVIDSATDSFEGHVVGGSSSRSK
jgi:serine/threonine protein kinase